MNIDQFVVMDAVVRLGSFNAASKALNRVQSAVSYNIKTLEQELGVELFSREGYKPSLTAAGEAIYDKARKLLMDVEEIEMLGAQFTQGVEPQVRFDLSPVCPLDVVTPALKEIASTHPATRLLMSMEVFGGEALVLDGQADISLTDMANHKNDQPGLETMPWREVELVAVVASDHPLTEMEELTRSLLLKYVQIVVGSNSPLTIDISMGILEGTTSWRVHDFATKRKLIMDGLGWGYLPQYMIKDDLEAGRLISIKPPGVPRQVARLHLVRKRGSSHGPVARHLWDLLKSLMDQN